MRVLKEPSANTQKIQSNPRKCACCLQSFTCCLFTYKSHSNKQINKQTSQRYTPRNSSSMYVMDTVIIRTIQKNKSNPTLTLGDLSGIASATDSTRQSQQTTPTRSPVGQARLQGHTTTCFILGDHLRLLQEESHSHNRVR